jgi:hypothetical protein
MIQLNNLDPKKEVVSEETHQQPILQPAPLLPKIQEVKKFDKICSPIKELLSRPPSSPVGSIAKSNIDIEEVNNAEIELLKENYE